MEYGGNSNAAVNQQIIQEVTTQLAIRSAPLPPVEEMQGYESILPGAADRIIAMAEKSNDSVIDSQKINGEINKKLATSEAWSTFIVTSFSVFLPWITCIVAILHGMTSLGWLTGATGFVVAGAQIIQAIRNKDKKKE